RASSSGKHYERTNPMKLILATLTAAAFPALAFAQTVDIDTAAGPVTVQSAPQTVVAFDLAAVDDLDALGVTVAAVPVVAPPAYLADAIAGKKTVGTLFEPDFEALAVM